MPLDCTNNNLTLEQIIGAILAKATTGDCALRFIPVADGNADWADCDNNNQDLEQLIKRLVGLDVNNQLGIRVIEVTDSGDNCLDCSNMNLPLEDIVTRSVIGLAADGHPALRIATL